MIQFVNSLNENRLRMAFNNDIIRFYSDKPAAPQYCDIKIAGIPGVVADADVRLYPNPQNQFFFNFKPYTCLRNAGAARAGVPPVFFGWPYR